jgi:hypothetical protein
MAEKAYVAFAQACIVRAIGNTPADIREAIKLMAGIEHTTKGLLQTREDILKRMAAVLNRRGRRAARTGETNLTERQIRALEHDIFAPEVARLIQEEFSRSFPTDIRYEAVEVDIKLQPGPVRGRLTMTIEFAALVPDQYWVVAVTRDERLADQLCAISPGVNEVLCPPRDGVEVPTLSLVVSYDDRKDMGGQRVPLKEAASEDIAKLLDAVELASFPHVHWLFGKLHSKTAPYLSRILFTSHQIVRLADRYAFWNAPRRLLLRRLSFDWSSFPDSASYEFMVLNRDGFIGDSIR